MFEKRLPYLNRLADEYNLDEDARQELYLSAFEYLTSHEGSLCMSSYYGHVKHKAKRLARPKRPEPYEEIPAVIDPEAMAIDRVYVEEVMSRLPEKDQEILWLVAQSHSLTDVGRELGLTREQVQCRYLHARNRFLGVGRVRLSSGDTEALYWRDAWGLGFRVMCGVTGKVGMYIHPAHWRICPYCGCEHKLKRIHNPEGYAGIDKLMRDTGHTSLADLTIGCRQVAYDRMCLLAAVYRGDVYFEQLSTYDREEFKRALHYLQMHSGKKELAPYGY